jgi:hypothetical protein
MNCPETEGGVMPALLGEPGCIVRCFFFFIVVVLFVVSFNVRVLFAKENKKIKRDVSVTLCFTENLQ